MQNIVRSLFFSFYLILSVILFTFIFLLLFFIPYKYRYIILKAWSISIIKSLDLICGLKVSFQGIENIPDKPCIIFSKHQSTLETIALQLLFSPQVWVLKKELLLIPFFGWSLSLTKPIAIDRSKGSESIKKINRLGKNRLEEGYWLIIFPEGTRTNPDTKVKYKIGGALLAEYSGFDILPIRHNTGYFWPKGQFVKKPGIAQFTIGPVVENKGRSAKDLLSEAEKWMEEGSI